MTETQMIQFTMMQVSAVFLALGLLFHLLSHYAKEKKK